MSLFFDILPLLALPLAAIWSKKKAPVPDKKNSPPGIPSVRKEARELRKKGEFLRAAELFEKGGEVELAAAMYREGKKPLLLGELYKRHKKWRDAANAFMEAGETEEAAKMFESDRDFRKAASLFEGLKQVRQAAEMYKKAYDFETAAATYEREGLWDEAAQAYIKAGKPLQAAELYETAYGREKTELDRRKRVGAGIQRKELRGLQEGAVSKLALEGAQIYKAHNQAAKAAELFMAIDRKLEAAEAYEEAGNLAKAAELFSALRRYSKAAQLYRKLGDPRRAAEITAAQHIESKNFSAAAEIFAEAKDHLRAGEFYQRAGLPDLAAQMFIQGGDIQRAAQMMRSAGNSVVAAAMFEQAGSHKDAAELHQQAGNDDRALELWVKAECFFEAGLLSHKMNRPEDAIKYLQKLNPQSGHYLEASILLGKIFLEVKMQDAARERFEDITANQPLSVKTIEAYYRLATILEGDGKPREAVDLYEKILAQDYNYADVKTRAAEIKANLTDRSGPKPDPESKGRYRILKEIGRGGMGVVYLAEDTLLGRKVAYKELPQALKNDPNMLKGILEEARMVAALNHPNIVTLHDAYTTREDSFLIMEYVEGMTLKQVLTQAPTLPARLIAEICIQVCAALEYAHSHKVIHQDIKPANIMTVQGRSVKVMDFGIARKVDSGTEEDTSIKGSPHFISPEQIQGTGVDHRSDIYSLGCTMYRMAAGRPPFTEGDPFYHHCHTPPRPPNAFNPEIPDALNDIIMRCIEKEPAGRYAHVGEVADHLKQLLS